MVEPLGLYDSCQHLVLLGRQPPSPGFQEAAKGCGGGQHLPYVDIPAFAIFVMFKR